MTIKGVAGCQIDLPGSTRSLSLRLSARAGGPALACSTPAVAISHVLFTTLVAIGGLHERRWHCRRPTRHAGTAAATRELTVGSCILQPELTVGTVTSCILYYNYNKATAASHPRAGHWQSTPGAGAQSPEDAEAEPPQQLLAAAWRRRSADRVIKTCVRAAFGVQC